MPKMKSRRAAAKRFKITGSGKIKIKRSNLRHILTKKSADRKRKLRKPDMVASCDENRVKRALVYC